MAPYGDDRATHPANSIGGFAPVGSNRVGDLLSALWQTLGRRGGFDGDADFC